MGLASGLFLRQPKDQEPCAVPCDTWAGGIRVLPVEVIAMLSAQRDLSHLPPRAYVLIRTCSAATFTYDKHTLVRMYVCAPPVGAFGKQGRERILALCPLKFMQAFRRCGCPPPSPFTTPVFLFSAEVKAAPLWNRGFWHGPVLLLDLLPFQSEQKNPARTAYRFRLDLQSSQGKRKASFMCYCN